MYYLNGYHKYGGVGEVRSHDQVEFEAGILTAADKMCCESEVDLVILVYKGEYQERPYALVHDGVLYEYAHDQLADTPDKWLRNVYYDMKPVFGNYQTGGEVKIHEVLVTDLNSENPSVQLWSDWQNFKYTVDELSGGDGMWWRLGNYVKALKAHFTMMYGNVKEIVYTNPWYIYKGFPGNYFIHKNDDGSLSIMVCAY